ncbi:MAG: AAA family ATPase, partial [Chloroflexota bacterium]
MPRKPTSALPEIKNQRRRVLEKHIKENYHLISEYEQKLAIAVDPKEKVRYKKEIDALQNHVKLDQREYEQLSSGDINLPKAGKPDLFPEIWLKNLPTPLAIPCAEFNYAGDDTARFLALDHLLANTVKYLAAAALACYRANEPEPERLGEWMRHLSSRRISDWQIILDDIADYFSEREDKQPLVIGRLRSDYLRPQLDTSAIHLAHHQVHHLLQTDPESKAVTIQHFLQALLDYRQYTPWEANVVPKDAKIKSLLVQCLQPALMKTLETLSFIQDFPLRFVEAVHKNDGGRLYQLSDWSGSGEQSTPGEDYASKNAADQPPFKECRLYLCSQTGKPVLNIYPLLVQYEKHLFFLEAHEADERLILRPCHAGGKIEEIPDGEHPSLRTIFDLLAKNADPIKELEKLETQVADVDKPKPDFLPLPMPVRFSEILPRLSDESCAALEIGLGESLRIGQFWLGVEFLLMGLSKLEISALSKKLAEIGLGGGDFRGALRGMAAVRANDWRKQLDVRALGAEALPGLEEVDPQELALWFGTDKMPKTVITPRLLDILRVALRLAKDGKVTDRHLLLAALGQPQAVPVNRLMALLVEAGQDPRLWIKQLEKETGQEHKPEAKPASGKQVDSLVKGKGLLGQLGRDLTALAHAGQLRPAVGAGARKAMTQIGLILQQTQANNPILLGNSGVGKTAIAEGLAWRLVNDKEVIAKLAGKRIVDLSPNSLMAGTKYHGDIEERLRQLLEEVSTAKGQVIVFIDEIHTLLSGQGALSDALKPALARGEFPCIGATTMAEYRRYIESDPALARRFTPVLLEEPSPAEAVEIALQVAQEHLGPSYGVEYPRTVVEEAVRLAVRYIHDEFLPGKVIKLLDQAGPRVTMGFSLRGVAADQKQAAGGTVSLEIIRQIVAERTGVPLASLKQDDRSKLLGLEQKL